MVDAKAFEDAFASVVAMVKADMVENEMPEWAIDWADKVRPRCSLPHHTYLDMMSVSL